VQVVRVVVEVHRWVEEHSSTTLLAKRIQLSDLVNKRLLSKEALLILERQRQDLHWKIQEQL
jgi:hypothetical protein